MPRPPRIKITYTIFGLLYIFALLSPGTLFLVAGSNEKCGLLLPLECSCDLNDGQSFISCKNVTSVKDVFTQLENEKIVSKLMIEGCKENSNLDSLVLPKVNIFKIQISDCFILNVAKNFFDNINKETLKEVTFNRCALKSIPNLPALSQLSILNLNNNDIDISSSEETFLNDVPGLSKLYLSDNKINTIPSNFLLSQKKNLQLLDLSKNVMIQVPAQTLRSSNNLTYLDLSQNSITEIFQFQFMNLPSLRTLSLASNNLSKISAMAFMNVPVIQVLNLKNNSLTYIDTTHLKAFDKLQKLDLSFNKLKHSPKFKSFYNLQQIDLSYNQITDLETLTFTENPKLTLLNCESNVISKIDRNSFNELGSLKVLLLANNKLNYIEKGAFTGLTGLQKLSLKYNGLTQIESKSFDPLSNTLTVLDLSNNNLTAIKTDVFDRLRNLFVMDVSHNQITELEEDSLINPVAELMLHDNLLNCQGKNMQWFLRYLLAFRVKVFYPGQSDIVCETPDTVKGLRFKDLLLQKANETLMAELDRKEAEGVNIQSEVIQKIPILKAISTALGPNFKINAVAPGSYVPPSALPQQANRASARSKLTDAQKLDLAMRGEYILKNLPNPVMNIPGLGIVNVSTFNKDTILYILNGGSLPGIPQEALDGAIEQLTMLVNSGEQQNEDTSRTLGEKPLVTQRLNGNESPKISSHLMQLMALLPAGYNVSSIPGDVINSVMAGQVPDFTLLPEDLKEHFKANIDKLMKIFDGMNLQVEDVLKKLPNTVRSKSLNSGVTFSPYDLNRIQFDLVDEIEQQNKRVNLQQLSLIALGVLTGSTFLIIIIIVFKLRQNQSIEDNTLVFDPKASINSTPPNTAHSQDFARELKGFMSARDYDRGAGHY